MCKCRKKMRYEIDVKASPGGLRVVLSGTCRHCRQRFEGLKTAQVATDDTALPESLLHGMWPKGVPRENVAIRTPPALRRQVTRFLNAKFDGART